MGQVGKLGYFGVRFRTKKYAVSYFSAESEAIALRPTEKRPQVQERGTVVEDLNAGGEGLLSRRRYSCA